MNRIQEIFRPLLLLPLLISLIGCSSGNPNSCRGVLSNQPYLTIGKDYDQSYYQTASESWLYAMMAANAYHKASEGSFQLPEQVKERAFYAPGRGLQAKLYAIEGSGSEIQTLVIAFRGTTSLLDWLFGNLLNSQYRLADQLVATIHEEYPGTELIAVGHSLGGGLALHVSLVFDDTKAYAFNPSYKVLSPSEPKINHRAVVGENGDILALQRKIWFQPKVEVTNPAYNCTLVNEHDITLLTRCLLHVAAAGDEAAKLSLAQNRSPLCGSVGWIYLGPKRDQQTLIKQFNQFGSATVTLAAEAYLRRDYPRAPFYRPAGAIRVIPAGTSLAVLDLIDSVGWRQRSWIKVSYDPVETKTGPALEPMESADAGESSLPPQQTQAVEQQMPAQPADSAYSPGG